jgi:hypothetical protein
LAAADTFAEAFGELHEVEGTGSGKRKAGSDLQAAGDNR